MKILSLLWGFSLGGIGKVSITYGQLNDNSSLELYTICIQIRKKDVDLKPLRAIRSKIIFIEGRMDFSWVKAIKNEILNFKPDKLFVHGFNGPVIAWFLQKFWFDNLKFICTYHGLYHAPKKTKKLFEPLFNWTARYIYKNFAEKVITVENFSKQFLTAKGVPASKIVVIHNGIPVTFENSDVELGKYNLTGNKVKIGLASRLDHVKGIEYILHALVLLKNKIDTPFALIIAGNGPLENKLKKMSGSLNLNDVVYFIGYQPEISKWMNIFDMFVLPSLFEYHSIALLEAMRASKAIIATSVGGNPESIQNGTEGLLIPPKNPGALAEALKLLIINPSLRSKLGKAANIRFKKEFTEEIMIENLKTILLNDEII